MKLFMMGVLMALLTVGAMTWAQVTVHGGTVIHDPIASTQAAVVQLNHRLTAVENAVRRLMQEDAMLKKEITSDRDRIKKLEKKSQSQ
jgi:peptidoglycan hydrolase CwlO-like protein